jgi:hypothetical protein
MSNKLASALCDKQEMERDIAQPVVGAKKSIVIPMTENIDPETGYPDIKLAPESYKRCPVCKTDKLT